MPESGPAPKSTCQLIGSRGSILRFSLLTIDAESLAVLRGCIEFVLRIVKRAVNRGLEPLAPSYKRIVSFLRQFGNQFADKRLHTPHNLYAVGTIETNFIESQEKKILPAPKWNQHAKIASAV